MQSSITQHYNEITVFTIVNHISFFRTEYLYMVCKAMTETKYSDSFRISD